MFFLLFMCDMHNRREECKLQSVVLGRRYPFCPGMTWGFLGYPNINTFLPSSPRSKIPLLSWDILGCLGYPNINTSLVIPGPRHPFCPGTSWGFLGYPDINIFLHSIIIVPGPRHLFCPGTSWGVLGYPNINTSPVVPGPRHPFCPGTSWGILGYPNITTSPVVPGPRHPFCPGISQHFSQTQETLGSPGKSMPPYYSCDMCLFRNIYDTHTSKASNSYY